MAWISRALQSHDCLPCARVHKQPSNLRAHEYAGRHLGAPEASVMAHLPRYSPKFSSTIPFRSDVSLQYSRIPDQSFCSFRPSHKKNQLTSGLVPRKPFDAPLIISSHAHETINKGKKDEPVHDSEAAPHRY